METVPSWKSEQRLWELCEGETELLVNGYPCKSFCFDADVEAQLVHFYLQTIPVLLPREPGTSPCSPQRQNLLFPNIQRLIEHTYHICRALLTAWLQLRMQAPHSLECTKKSANNFLLELPKHPKTALQTLQQCACSYSMRMERSALLWRSCWSFVCTY